MNIKLALEWFLNPDHLPFLVAKEKGLYDNLRLELEIIEPKGHYDGFSELSQDKIQFATNEPLHLIEEHHKNVISLGNFFETNGGIIFSELGYEKLISNKDVNITSPVSNEVTDTIAKDIIARYTGNNDIKRTANVAVNVKDFYHVKNLKNGMDAAWLCFENFEGVECILEGMRVRKIYLEDVNIPNFCALDLFTSNTMLELESNLLLDFKKTTEEAVSYFNKDLDYAKYVFYKYSSEKETDLMNNIIEDTIPRFYSPFEKSKRKWFSLYEYTRQNKISKLTEEQYNSMFYEF